MADEWIKWTKGLVRKREVVAIAAKLKLSRREVAAILMEVWEWADDNSVDGYIPGVRPEFIDELVGVSGLAGAMDDVGWLLSDDAGVIFPNFNRHNGEPAKQRARAAERQRQHRTRQGTGVTEVSQKSVTKA